MNGSSGGMGLGLSSELSVGLSVGLSTDDLVRGTGGKLRSQHGNEFSEIVTDSRKDVRGKIFIALKGDTHDGHQYIMQAVENGASAIISHEWTVDDAPLLTKTTWIQVDDTLKALQNLAQFWREKWGKTVIAVTGSNGKTTVKDFATTLLEGQFCTLKNEGSFNNHWGLPLTLLKLNPEHEVAMLEMGMNHAGEITDLCRIAQPNIVVVNNVGRAHIEHFGTVEGIAKAKEEIYQDLPKSTKAAFNLADPRTADMHARLKDNFSRTITFGTAESDVEFRLFSSEVGGLKIHCRLYNYEQTLMIPLFGAQNVLNLMTASSLALLADVKVEVIFSQLEKCQTGWGRNQWVMLHSGAQALFDAYNANPDSFAALISNLPSVAKADQKMIGIFSEMRELGEQASAEHFELGKNIASSPIHECYFAGASQAHFKAGFEAAKSGKNLFISDSYEDSLALKLKSMLNNKTLVVIKGSRGGALEKVLVGLGPKNFTTK